ncbi:hypothetical protein [Leptothermofonsia sp. ETS-13]|uniref:hypothetical protein n=1 Tax=Leptothermofonsia sp. ETS-13 TaxID=3035696 RepID=UPI003B9DDCB8
MGLSQHQPNRNYEASTANPKERHSQFVSLRVKILLGFSMVFSIVFAGAFYWFYTFTTEKTISRLRADMKSTLIGAANGIDVKELLALYAGGKPNADGFSDDPRFQH